MNKIKKITDPDYESQTVSIEYDDGTVEAKVCVHTNPANAFYVYVGERIYLEDLSNGEWLCQMLR